jgi:hypothetical protein
MVWVLHIFKPYNFLHLFSTSRLLVLAITLYLDYQFSWFFSTSNFLVSPTFLIFDRDIWPTYYLSFSKYHFFGPLHNHYFITQTGSTSSFVENCFIIVSKIFSNLPFHNLRIFTLQSMRISHISRFVWGHHN